MRTWRPGSGRYHTPEAWGPLCLETGRCSLTLLASLNAVAPLLHRLLSLFTLPSSSGVYLPRRLRLGVAGLGLGLWLIAYYQVRSLPLKIDGRAAGSHASYCRWHAGLSGPCRPHRPARAAGRAALAVARWHHKLAGVQLRVRAGLHAVVHLGQGGGPV